MSWAASVGRIAVKYRYIKIYAPTFPQGWGGGGLQLTSAL